MRLIVSGVLLVAAVSTGCLPASSRVAVGDGVSSCGGTRPRAGTAVPRIRMLWAVLPTGSALWKTIDILAGLIMGTQFLHEHFVEQRIASNPSFGMDDRTPVGR